MSVSNYQAMIELVQKLAGKKDWSTQIYITITEDALAGLFLDRILWWSDKSSREDGFFWKKADEWEQELFISYAQIKRLTGILEKKGFIETKIQRANGAPTLHYRPVLSSIINAIKSKFKKVEIQESRNSEKSEMEIEESLKSEIQESSISITAKTSKDSSKLPNGSSQKPQATDPEKWNNANKKIVGDKFLELTHLPPPGKKESGAWWGWLFEIFEMADKDSAKTCQIMGVVVKYMQDDHLTISSPKSLINLARSVVSGQELKSRNGFHQEPARASPKTLTDIDHEKLKRLQEGLE